LGWGGFVFGRKNHFLGGKLKGIHFFTGSWGRYNINTPSPPPPNDGMKITNTPKCHQNGENLFILVLCVPKIMFFTKKMFSPSEIYVNDDAESKFFKILQ